MDPARFEDMRPGCFDIDARVADMDLNGVWASLCFPSLVAGFCGSVFIRSDDPELGLACLRAWNQWHHEVWAGTFPERIIPLQLPWLADVEVAAAEVRANAERGFKAVSFPEFPAQLGLPVDLHRATGTRFFAACEETGTVVCLHTGSSAWAPLPSPVAALRAAPHPLSGQRADRRGRVAVVGRARSASPELAVALSEGGIGWVPMLADRVDYVLDHSASGTESISWPSDLRPSEVLKRNFWFCTIDDPSVVDLRHGHRGGPHHGGERLSPRRLDLARHPGGHGGDPGWSGRGRAADGGGGQCGPPVPPPLPPRRRLAGLGPLAYPVSRLGARVSCWISMVLPAGSVNQIWTVVPWAPST